MNWKTYLLSLLNASISGAAASATVMVVDPNDFNFHQGLTKLSALFGVSFVISALKWLAQHSIPGAVVNGDGK